VLGQQCDWDYGFLREYEGVLTGSECQYICRGVPGANYFTHYNEGPEADHGWCGCFSQCYWPEVYDCRSSCHSHETWEAGDISEVDALLEAGDTDSAESGLEEDVAWEPQPRPGGVCHCMWGPLQPDVDSCDIWG